MGALKSSILPITIGFQAVEEMLEGVMTCDILELLIWEETVGAVLSLSAGDIGWIVALYG